MKRRNFAHVPDVHPLRGSVDYTQSMALLAMPYVPKGSRYIALIRDLMEKELEMSLVGYARLHARLARAQGEMQ